MTTTGSHDRFSELIGPHLRRELSVDDARDLEEHLATCARCRAEVSAARALVAGAPDALTEAERHALHEAVADRVGGRKAEIVPLSPRGARVAKVLAAAAVIAGIAAAGIWAGTSGLGDGSNDSAGNEMAAEDSGGAEGAAAAPEPSFLDSPSSALSLDTQTENDGGGGQDDGTVSTFSGVPLTEERLARYAEEGPLFNAFADAHAAPVPRSIARRALTQLASQAPGQVLQDQVNECGGDYLERNPEKVLSVAALVGDYEDDRALVIGFATTALPPGPLDRYTYVVWRLGDCRSPLASFTGALHR